MRTKDTPRRRRPVGDSPPKRALTPDLVKGKTDISGRTIRVGQSSETYNNYLTVKGFK